MDRHWALVISAERYAHERLLSNDALGLTGLEGRQPASGDLVVLIAATGDPVAFGLGRVSGDEVVYTHRAFDEPATVDASVPGQALGGAAGGEPVLHPLDADTFDALASRIQARQGGPARRSWMVSLDLPIEASTPAEAVRTFWTYAQRLGPAELPTFVSPAGDELAMQAYVLGEPTNLDPED